MFLFVKLTVNHESVSIHLTWALETGGVRTVLNINALENYAAKPVLALLHSEQPKLFRVSAVLRAIGLSKYHK